MTNFVLPKQHKIVERARRQSEMSRHYRVNIPFY